MVAQQLVPPVLSSDPLDPKVHEAILSIRPNIGTKVCFPDVEPILAKAERDVGKVKTFDAKRRGLEFAIRDLEYVLGASDAMYHFLAANGGIDDPEPFHAYFKAGELSLTYLYQCLDYLSHEESTPPPSDADVSRSATSAGANPPVKPVMRTVEVADYIGRAATTVRHYVMEDKIPYHRTSENSFPQFLKTEIDEWITKGLCPSRKGKKSRAKAKTTVPEPLTTHSEEPRRKEAELPHSMPIISTPLDRHAVIIKMAALLERTGHIEEPSTERLVSWIESGCSLLPVQERIDWLKGRKTLFTFIVCAYHAALLSLDPKSKRVGPDRPKYETIIMGSFLEKGEPIKEGINRSLVKVEAAMLRFREVMSAYSASRYEDSRATGNFFDNIDDYLPNRNLTAFEEWRLKIECDFEVGKERTTIVRELEIGILSLFWDLTKAFPELLTQLESDLAP
jgi:predicted DNA-binding transcriptional regulator AlpA